MFSRISIKSITALLLISIILPSSLLLYPKNVEAQSGGCAAVFAGAVTAGVAYAKAKMAYGVDNSGDTAVLDTVSAGSDYGKFFNDCILKPIAIRAARNMVQQISQGIVKWINNDFNGRPGFAVDMKRLIVDSADATIGEYIYGSALSSLCQPFSARIKLLLQTKYYTSPQEQVRCTLTQIVGNVNGFVNNNGGTGWNNWLSVTTQPQNNVYGAYLIADSQLTQNIQGNLDKLNNMVNRNGGFLDYKVCDADAADREGPKEIADRRERAQNLKDKNQYVDPAEFSLDPKCTTGGRSVTPGSLVQGQASKVLGGWADQLNLATEIDQIVGALISHFAEKITSSGGKGFLGLSGGAQAAPRSASTLAAIAASETGSPTSDIGGAIISSGDQVQDEINDVIATPVNNQGGGAQFISAKSSSGTGVSAFLTDGNMETLMITDEQDSPWIEGDLGSSFGISEVQVFGNPQKSGVETIGTVRVVISNTSGGRTWVSNPVTVASGQKTVSVPVNTTGRYVRIERENNSFSCTDPEGMPSTCHYPLEISELQVIAFQTNISAGNNTNQQTTGGGTMTLGPVSGVTTVARGSTFIATIPVTSSQDMMISALELKFSLGNTPINFDSVIDNLKVVRFQNNIQTFSTPTGSSQVDFISFSVGPSNVGTISIDGKVKVDAPTGTYQITLTAKNASGAPINTYTTNFIVQ